MPKPNPKRLLVEGAEDRRVIPFFMENFISWGDTKSAWPVEIESFNGIEDMLKPGVIEAELKTSGLRALGVIVDANDHPAQRWRRIRERAIAAVPALPNDIPETGLVAINTDGLRFGAWLMPDNRSRGMLETFLSLFIPPEGQLLWTYAQAKCGEAKNHGASYKEVHADKARIHTWLAWQDDPGQSLHLAVLART
jgi:hypothetical protein